jgi:hypothetical protein
LIKYNWGDWAIPLVPQVSLGKVEQQDFSSLATAIATLYNAGFISPVQLQALDTMLGLPARPSEEIMRLIKQDQNGSMLADASMKSMMNPDQSEQSGDDTSPVKDDSSSSSGNPFAKKKPAQFSNSYEKELREAEELLESQVSTFFSKQKIRVT